MHQEVSLLRNTLCPSESPNDRFCKLVKESFFCLEGVSCLKGMSRAEPSHHNCSSNKVKVSGNLSDHGTDRRYYFSE